MYLHYSTILVEMEDTLCILSMNRPKLRNAINEAMLDDLNDFLEKAKDDPRIRALVITGAGKGFSPGADVGDWNDIYESGEESLWVPKGQAMIKALKRFPKPVIAAVNGVAVGAGCDMALAADICYGSTTARFSQAYVKMGFSPDNGGTYLLPRIVGWRKATEMIFTGDAVNAEEACRIGLLNYITAPEDLLPLAKEMGQKLAKGPTVAITQAKANLEKSWLLDFDAELEQEKQSGDICEKTEDTIEAVKAFVEKREPVFKGR